MAYTTNRQRRSPRVVAQYNAPASVDQYFGGYRGPQQSVDGGISTGDVRITGTGVQPQIGGYPSGTQPRAANPLGAAEMALGAANTGISAAGLAGKIG